MFIELTDAETKERLTVNVNKICTIRPYFEGTRLFFETVQTLLVSEKYNEIKEMLWRLDLADFSLSHK